MPARPFDYYLQAADEYLTCVEDVDDADAWRSEVAEAYEIEEKDRHWLDQAIRQLQEERS